MDWVPKVVVLSVQSVSGDSEDRISHLSSGRLPLKYSRPIFQIFSGKPIFQFVEISIMREIVHVQAGQCGNQIGAKVRSIRFNTEIILAY